MAEKRGKVPTPPGPSKKTVIDTAVQHQVYVEKTAAGMAEQVKGAGQQMADDYAAWLKSQLELTDLTADEVQKLLASSAEEQSAMLAQHIEDYLMPQLSDLADYEADFQAKALAVQTRGITVKSLKAGKAFEEALANPLPATGDLLEPFISDWAENEVANVGKLINQGWSQGWTNDQIVKGIRGTKAADYKDGLMPSIGNNAKAIVRTAVQHIAQTAREVTWAKNSDIIVAERVVATLDSNTTIQCRSLDGKEYPVGKGPQFPLHIGCRTTKVAVLAKEYAALQEGSQRASEFGPTDANQTYYEWLGDQDEAFQDDALGPTRAQLFREGGLTAAEFARLNLGRNFAPMTLDEMRRKEPEAFKRAGLIKED